MSNAKITLYGFTRWMELNGKDLFEHLTLPAGIDKQLFTDNLMMEAGEFGVLYSDPELMARMIGVWGRKHYRTFDKWITVLNKEYEPLYNLDVFEEWQDTGSSSGSRSGTSGSTTGDTLTGGYSRTDGYTKSGTNESSQSTSGSETIGEDITDTLDETNTNDLKSVTEGSTTTENTRSAFDSSTYQPHDKSEVTADSTTEDTGTVKKESEAVRDRDQTTTTTGTVSGDGEFTETNAGTQTDTHNESRTITSSGTTGESTEGETASEHTGHRYGNQGVTMSQQMLQAELDVQRWNIYEHMTDLFIQDFCIAVYI